MTRRLLLVSVLLSFVVSACSLGPREDWAQTMRDAFAKAKRSGGTMVHETVELKVIETTIRETPEALWTDLSGYSNLKDRRTKLAVHKPKGAAGPIIFDDLVTYVPRSRASIEQHGATKARWARFDYRIKPKDPIDTNDRRLAIGVAAISPALALELLDGVLAGSIRRVGSASVRGVSTTEYSARMAPDASVRELRNDRRRQGILRLFENLGVVEEVFPMRVWIDDDDYVRRIRFVLRQQKDRVNAFRTTIDYEFTKYGAGQEIKIPPKSETLRSRRFEDFVVEYIRQLI